MTTYHLRNNDGTEVFTGTISPAPGGGFQPGYAFAFNSPRILTGFPLWTPALGDVLGDATAGHFILSVPPATPFDGSTPTLHFGSLAAGVFTDLTGGGFPLSGAADSAAAMGSSLWSVTAWDILSLASPLVQTGTDQAAILIDDGSGGDPGMSTGAGVLFVQRFAAP